MNWKVEKGTEADAGKIAEFQIDMALESEGAILDRDKILNGVRAGLSDPAKGTYYIVRTESGETAGRLLVTKEWSDWNNCDYSGINVPLVAVCNVPPVAQCNVPPQKWLQ